MISSPFPHHTIASLRQVGMMGLTPLRFELNRVKLFGTELDTHTNKFGMCLGGDGSPKECWI